MSAEKGTEFGTAISGLIGAVLLVAAVYLLTVAQFSTPSAPAGPDEIAGRLAPVGSITLAGAEGTAAPAAVPAAPAAPAAGAGPGEAIYQKACFACHLSGAAGAPKLDDKAAWEPRVAQGIDQLVQTAVTGKGAMPPRGTCADCSDEDLRAAIEYMLAQAGFEVEGATGTDEAPAAEESADMEGMGGMSGAEGMSGMGGMSGMDGASRMPVKASVPAGPKMEGMGGMSGEYRTAPDGSVYLFPADMGGMSGMGGASGEGGTPVPDMTPGTWTAPAQ